MVHVGIWLSHLLKGHRDIVLVYSSVVLFVSLLWDVGEVYEKK